MLCSDKSHEYEWLEPLDGRIMEEGSVIQMTAASSLSLSLDCLSLLPQLLTPFPWP